jgi:cation:H+ antiporter
MDFSRSSCYYTNFQPSEQEIQENRGPKEFRMIITLLLISGLALLYFGAEFLVKGAVAIAQRLGIGPLVIGLTIVAFGTSLPELTVSIQAALAGSGDIAAANVVGSNIFNIALILGLAAVVCPIRITANLIRVDIPIMIAVSLLGIGMLHDRHLSRSEGMVLSAGIVGYLLLSYYLAYKNTNQRLVIEAQEMLDGQKTGRIRTNLWLNIGLIAFGMVLLVGGSKALVSGAVRLAQVFGLSEAIIGLTIVSAGTSLPELATSVVAAFRKQPDIAVGNVIGSNIFNLLAILGISSVLVPYAAPGIGSVDLAVMLAVAVISLPMMWSRFTLSRLEGAILLGCYGAYMGYLLMK